ncbi:esterase [Algimonas arctica]|uniref:Esterase n=1 Tax=Algimonas arctica TaxID=1479486 RepID=A0A8J3CTK3_9PROT|nr:alpha/beta hydrolase-fold protein [Algimonas arctica]GHB04255.1 esterase [Algimonas arctica]
MRTALIGITLFALTACAQAETQSVETPVDPNSVAGDFRGITGAVERFTVTSSRVTTRDVEVWLPPSYASNPDRHYPVLYMHDGQNLFDPEQSKYAKWDWGIDEALSALIIDKRVPEVIVVGIHSDEATRNFDYFPQKAGGDHAEVFRRDFGEFDSAGLNADNYLDFLVTEIKPRIDVTYRTQPERDETFVMGSSMGGLISLYAISEYPEIFGGAGMVSSHFPLADGVLVDYFATRLPDPSTHRLYFDFGTETLDHNYESYQDRMDQAVEATGYTRGVNWTTRKYEGHDHSERAWRNRVHVPLQFLLNKSSVPGGEER